MAPPGESYDEPSPLEALLPESAPPRRIGPGALVDGRFEIQSEVGSGSMGRIFLARDSVLDEPIALKVLRPELLGQGNSSVRFLAEIRLARQVSHPNVCRIYDYGEDGEIRYITMEYVEGTDLDSILADRQGGLEPGEAYQVALGAAAGMAAIHRSGVLHRDLKTSNIMIDREGVVRVMDFGLAKGWGKRSGPALTAKGTLLGTPEYMSPEQCTGEELDQRTDIYSLGIVCFEIFTGDVPFKGETLMKTLMHQLRTPPPLDGPEAERLPPPLIPVLRKALAKRPADRYQSVAELIEALDAARRESERPEPAPSPRPPETPLVRPERRRHDRLDFPVNCCISVVGPGGEVHEERTVAENISIGGVRVRTAFSSLREGDRVIFDEMEGTFKAQSEVRCCRVAPDNVLRLHLQFVGEATPRHLVGSG